MYDAKFLEIEGVKGLPDTIAGILKDTVVKWTRKIDWMGVLQNIGTSLKNLWEQMTEIKDEMITCVA